MNATVSIVIPGRDRPELLREALASCLAQTYSSIEIVVVDDGSDQPLDVVVDAVCGADPRVRCVRQARGGASRARNCGLRESHGAYVQFLDSDDCLHPEKLARAVAALEQSSAVDMVFSLGQYFSRVPGDGDLLWNGLFPAPEIGDFLAENVPWDTNAPVWRRTALERIGPWDETLACSQDLEFHARAMCAGIQVRQQPAILHFIRDHAQGRISGSAANRRTMEASRLLAWELISQHLRTAGLWSRRHRRLVAIAAWGRALPLAWCGFWDLAARAYLTAAQTAPWGAVRALAWAGHAVARRCGEGQRPPRSLRLLYYVGRLTGVGRAPRSGWKTLRTADVASGDVLQGSGACSPA